METEVLFSAMLVYTFVYFVIKLCNDHKLGHLRRLKLPCALDTWGLMCMYVCLIHLQSVVSLREELELIQTYLYTTHWDSEVTTPWITSYIYLLLGEQGLHIKRLTQDLNPSLLSCMLNTILHVCVFVIHHGCLLVT